MSKKPKSADIDKQLQETFAVYIVDPMHDDMATQLADLQKKWLGTPEQYDEDTPYLESLMDGCLQRTNSKLDKQQMVINEHFSNFSSFLQDIRANTDTIDQVADTADAVLETVQAVPDAVQNISGAVQSTSDAVQNISGVVQSTADAVQNISGVVQSTSGAVNSIAGTVQIVGKSIDGLGKSVATLSQETKQQTEEIKTILAGDSKTVLAAISASAEKNRASMEKSVIDLTQRMSGTVDAISQQGMQERMALSEKLDHLAAQVRSFEEQAVQNSEMTSMASNAIERLTERYQTDLEALRKWLYLSLALNGAALLGIAAALLLLL